MKEKKDEKLPLTRRRFLTTMGVGAAAVISSGHFRAGASPRSGEVPDPSKMTRIELNINGLTYRLLVEPRWPLLFVLREQLGLTGAKEGCGRGECGACTVLMDDVPRYACMTLAVEAEGTHITTLEGLMKGEKLGVVQRSFAEHDALQCGYCTPGQIMAAEGLLRHNPAPSDDEIRRGASGNLCRCGAYNNIFKAVKNAALEYGVKNGK